MTYRAYLRRVQKSTNANRLSNGSPLAAHGRLLVQRTRLPASLVYDASIKAHMAFALVRHGCGENEHMRRLAYALNMAALLSQAKNQAEAMRTTMEAQDALMMAHSESHKLKRWIIRDALFEPICRALSIYDKQLAIATQAQIIAADRELVRMQSTALPVSPAADASDSTRHLLSVDACV